MDVTHIKQLLAEIAAELDGEAAPVSVAPDGMVAVYPTGVRGAGKVRYYPDPATMGETPDDLNLWGYHSVLAAQGIVPSPRGPYDFSGPETGRLARSFATYPEAVDRIEHGDDWATQADIDMAARLAERDRGSGFSPR